MSDRLTVDTITSDQLDALYDELDAARTWARHGYEIGQRHCGWSDHGVAPAWLTEGWPPHIDSCEHLKQMAQFDEALTRVRALHRKATHGDDCVHCAAFGPGYDNTWPCQTVRVLDGTAPVPPAPAATDTAELEKTTRVFAALHQSAEQDVSRVIALYEQWVKAGPPPLGTSVARWWDARLVELRAALAEPAPAASTPLVDRPFRSHRPKPAPAEHLGNGANAEDCPACADTNPPYPFICPGPTPKPGCACTYGERCPNCRD